MKTIAEILSIVAHVIVNAVLAGAAIGVFAGSAYSAFWWVAE